MQAHFTGICGARLDLSSARVSLEAEAARLACPWPGHIRELEDVVHFAPIVRRDGLIRRSLAEGLSQNDNAGAEATMAH